MKTIAPFVGLVLSLGAASAVQLADNPLAYFGGVNNGGYIEWLVSNDIEGRYNSSVFMPSRDLGFGAAVHWRVDEEYLHLAVAARASGWVGFGLSEAGGMLGSDLALFSMSRPLEIVDGHVVENPLPKEDDCQRDWVYVNSSISTAPVSISREAPLPEALAADPSPEFIMFETRRKLVTDDPQDFPIVRDNLIAIPETRIIAAWGDSPEPSYHGTNTARGSVRFFRDEAQDPDFEESMKKHADGSFFLGADNYVIPGENSTTYVDFCVSRKDLIAQGVPNTTDPMSVIGFKPILDDGPSAAFVHHYIVTGIFNASDDACEMGQGFDLVYVWAPGDGAFALPDFLGGSLFGDDGFQAFSVEIHYDNPRFERDVVDSSGVEIFYSTTPRPVEIGVLQVGDPAVELEGEAVGDGLSSHHFECPGSCSSLYLDEPVTVFREYLHMHIAGTRSTNEHIRDGEVIRTATTEVWDFNQNGNVAVKQQPYELRPGDSFRTNCWYRGNADSVFGLASEEEMCIAFLYYYPRKVIEVPTPQGNFSVPFFCGLNMDFFDNACNAEYTYGGILESDDQIERVFGTLPEQCMVASDANANDPAIVLEPAPAPADAPATPAQVETPVGRVPVPAPAPAPESQQLRGESTSGATLAHNGIAVFFAVVAAAML